MSFERSILRAGQAVKSVRPENKFLGALRAFSYTLIDNAKV